MHSILCSSLIIYTASKYFPFPNHVGLKAKVPGRLKDVRYIHHSWLSEMKVCTQY